MQMETDFSTTQLAGDADIADMANVTMYTAPQTASTQHRDGGSDSLNPFKVPDADGKGK